MDILLIILIVLLSVCALLFLLTLLPVSVYLKFKDDFFLKIKVGGIKVYEIEPESDIKEKSPEETSDKKAEKTTESSLKTAFEKLKQKHGFSGSIIEIFEFLKAALLKIEKYLKHVLIRKLCLDIKIASSDVATTAIEYGAVCSAVYPVLSFIQSIANAKYKSINVSADFDSSEPQASFEFIIKVKIIFLILMAFGIFSEYNNFKTRNEL